MKNKITITGAKVHGVGYRAFLLWEATDVGIERFRAYNIMKAGNQIVVVIVDGSDDQVEEFIDFARNNKPGCAEVSDIQLEEYSGNVMKIETYSMISTNEQLNKGVNAILQLTNIQASMLGKQDITIEKLDDVRADVVGEIRALRGDIRDAFLPGLAAQIQQLQTDLKQLQADVSSIKEQRRTP